MEGFLLVVRLGLFGIFALAGIGKLLDLEGSKKAVKDFGVPEGLAGILGTALPLVELAVAGSLLFISTSWFGSIGGLALLGVFTGGMAYQMAKGNAPDCHCFGQIHNEPVSRKSLIRNAVFGVFAVVLVVSGQGQQGGDLTGGTVNGMQLTLGIIIVALVAAVLLYLKQISEQQALILRRIDLLETISREGLPVERSNAGNPDDALPIGTPFPDFELPDLGGRIVAFNHILADAKPILFLFVGPNCVPCRSLLPEIESWGNELGDKLNFVFISTGKPVENIEKFGESGARAILLQKEREVAEFVNAKWTPTALFVGADGLIASRPAVGDNAIRDLVGKIEAENLDAEFMYIANGNAAPDRLPKIGEKIPEFSLKDLEGTEISSRDLRGKRTLVTFWSTTCPHCSNMMEELKAWEKQRSPNDPELLVFSDGDPDAHRSLALDSTLVLDKDYKTAEKFGMFGTPSAVLVNEDGTIVSETAVGAPNIWALIGKRKL